MTGPEHDRLRMDLGSYLIGSLAPAERAALDHHLPGCADCRAEIAALAPLPGLLGRLSADEARGGDRSGPGPEVLAGALDLVRAEERVGRRRLWRWRAVALAAGIVAVTALAIPPLVAAAAPRTALVTAAGTSAGGTGRLSERPWGTAVELDLSGLPSESGYRAYALSRDGGSEIAASWGATADGHAAITGATALSRADISSVQIRTASGRTLLTLAG